MTSKFAQRVRHVLDTEGEAQALQIDGIWYNWAQIAAGAAALDAVLPSTDEAGNIPAALVLRNRAASVAALLGLAASERTAVIISPIQPAETLARDVEAFRPAVLIAETQDWSAELIEAARKIGAMGIELAIEGGAILARPMPDLYAIAPGDHYTAPDDAGIVVPTSGTTGPPKRIPLSWRRFEDYLPNEVRETPPEKRRTIIIAAPLVTITGLGPFLSWATRPLKLALMERLDVKAWAELVREHRPRQGGLPPAAMRMMLDSDIPAAHLSSLEGWYTGAAPLDVETAERFEARFGVPVLTAYGATEFGGAVAGWTIEDHRIFSKAKRASTGRVRPGCALRIVDAETGEAMPAGVSGVLEVRTPMAAVATKDGWVRTNDLAHIDEDGFLFIEGRADDVIIRGGFKVAMFEVERALEEHPAVKQAAGIGLPDTRLGQIPAVAVTLEASVDAPTEDELIAWARQKLAAYKVPVVIAVVDALPMNASMKISRPLLREMLLEAQAQKAPA